MGKILTELSIQELARSLTIFKRKCHLIFSILASDGIEPSNLNLATLIFWFTNPIYFS